MILNFFLNDNEKQKKTSTIICAYKLKNKLIFIFYSCASSVFIYNLITNLEVTKIILKIETRISHYYKIRLNF